MSAPDTAPPEALSGDYLGFAIVSEFNTSNESTEIIGHTMGEASISPEYEAVETTYHETALTQQHNKHYTLGIEFTLALVPDLPQLETLGIDDGDGNLATPNASAKHEAIRVFAFNQEPDYTGLPESADQAWEFVGCEVAPGETSLSPGDPGEVPVTVVVNGGWRFGTTTPPA